MAFEKLKGMNFKELAAAANFSNVNETIIWLQSLNLLAEKVYCNRCNAELAIRVKTSVCDGMMWRCRNKACRTSTSIRKNSFFENRNTTFQAMLTAIYFWSRNYSQELIVHECRIARQSVIEICHLLREVCSVELQCCDLIGGPGHNVAIDGYFVSRGECRKRSKPSPIAFWIISGVDLQTKECFMCMADDRNESTMVDIIEQYVAFGSNIYWQKWGSELRFGDHELQQYSFHAINPSKPTEGITRTRINDLHNLWHSWKMKEKSKSFVAKKVIPSYIDEFMWRRKRPQNHVFADILEAISKQYLAVQLPFPSGEELTNNSPLDSKEVDLASVKCATPGLKNITDTCVATKDCTVSRCSGNAAVSKQNPLRATDTDAIITKKRTLDPSVTTVPDFVVESTDSS